MRVYQFRHVGITKDSDYSVKLREVNSPMPINCALASDLFGKLYLASIH
jgi:hypothetical protein